MTARAAAAQKPKEPDFSVVRSETIMGTRVTLTVWVDDEVRAARAASAVFAEFRRVDRLMTTWREGSDVSRINAQAGKQPVPVAAEVIRLLVKARQVGRQSGGAFDVTVGAFRGLWKFDEDKDGTIPNAAEVKERLALIDYRDVLIDTAAGTVKLRRPGMRITLGGIAKGYAVDRAAAILYRMDVVDFIVQAGGDLFVSGRRGSRRWRVGIRDPRGSESSVFAVAEVENRTFSTSGDYERSVVRDGVRYHHILDPKTGYPARRSRSVTVMARDAVTADAWSTALFVLGAQRGLAVVENDPDLEAVFVDAENRVHISRGLRDKVRLIKQPTPGI